MAAAALHYIWSDGENKPQLQPLLPESALFFPTVQLPPAPAHPARTQELALPLTCYIAHSVHLLPLTPGCSPRRLQMSFPILRPGLWFCTALSPLWAGSGLRLPDSQPGACPWHRAVLSDYLLTMPGKEPPDSLTQHC